MTDVTYKRVRLSRVVSDPGHQLPPLGSFVWYLAENWDAGFSPPIVVAEEKRWFRRTRYYIIDGTHRVAAARKLGIKTLPAVIHKGLARAERARLCLSMNRSVSS